MYEDVRVLLEKENKHCRSLMKMIIFIFSILATCFGKELGPLYCDFCQPEQLHISFGEKANDIVVTWSTLQSTNESRVQYGERHNNFNLEVYGTSKLFVDGGPLARSQYIHTVTLKDLKFGIKYVYHAGSMYGWSERFSFHTPPEGADFPVRAAIYGDMGNADAHSLSFLQDEAERDNFDLILHVGDFAYDMDSEDAQVGDQFMRQIQPLAALVPYMTCPGNHEEMYNFSNYAARFSMPGRDASLFYSFDLGPVHFVSISTEVYYFIEYGMDLISNQFDWLRQDLEKANLPETRLSRPWIVLFGHRPMYCTNSRRCDHVLTRVGINRKWALEPFLKDYGVDLVIWAHEHSYERTYPMYDGSIYKGSEEQPYVNPGAPVHIITGSAGCREGKSEFGLYHAGSMYGWSERFSFHTPPEGKDFPVRAAIYGDMGNADAHSLSFLQDEAKRDNFDLILHVGDFAYDLDTEDAQVGDQFMRQIQPIAATVPYMTCPGNHEKKYNFSNYAARFSMPGRDASLFYSFDLGPVHFVSISTEVYYYYIEYGSDPISNQFDWIKQDLQEANLSENRSNRPWIVLFGHRPMYCTNIHRHCDHEITRTGLNGKWALEPFLKDYGVDLAIWAHQHSYERTYPLYDGKMYKGSEEQPYVNPIYAEWSAFRNSDFGYSRFVAHNKTHIYMEQVSVELAGQVIDSFWLVKDEHKPYDFIYH